jgi:hypothetical protein
MTGTPLSPRMARQRQRRQQATPLVAMVRAFIALGVPCDTGGGTVQCYYCGGGLLVEGHADTCAWVRVRERVAGEG